MSELAVRPLLEFVSRWRVLSLTTLVLALASCSTPPTSTPVPILAEVASPTHAYTVTPTLGGWSRSADDLASDGSADLEFLHEEYGVSAVFYVDPGVSNSLDDYVLRRRARIAGTAKVLDLEETRRFHDDGSFTTASISRYVVNFENERGSSSIISGVLRGPTLTIEILVLGGPSPQNRTLMEDLLDGVRFEDTRPHTP